MSHGVGEDIVRFNQALKSKRLRFKDFDDDFESTPKGLWPLISACRDLMDLLLESEDVFSRHNRPYPAQTTVLRRFDEVELFLGRFQDGEEVPRIWSSPGLYDTTRARRIQDTMLMECQKLIQFLLIVSL
jgi:hypothetical protein